ncbi:hypothetical protein FOL47_005590 [Perkinsus chesapeaki]|uniref:Uncharacterized protein n=1 Tax=Perkinsus chesapeaki TaxID=330153 RepID=A0A7J6LWL0_PERCH|nr:hypothetical protein FOL47_005590 [Perkinsus chesapeaki]
MRGVEQHPLAEDLCYSQANLFPMVPTRTISYLLIAMLGIGKLIDHLPAKYCIEIAYGSYSKKLYVRHEVTFWSETYMEYEQYNYRWFVPWWRNKRGLKHVPMHYNPCADAPQPYVMDRDFEGFYFTKKEFAAMRHYDNPDELELTISGTSRLLTRCKVPWDANIREVVSNATDASVKNDLSE